MNFGRCIVLACVVLGGAGPQSLGLCVYGDPTHLCADQSFEGWNRVVERYGHVAVLFLIDKECEEQEHRLRRLIEAVVQEAEFEYIDEAAVLREAAGTLASYAEKGLHLRLDSLEKSDTGMADHDMVAEDPMSTLKGALLRFFYRHRCGLWSAEKEERGLAFDWLMLVRMEISWRSFPDVKDLDSAYPVIWTNFRPVEAILPHRSDRCLVGKRDVMTEFLVLGLTWFLSLERYVGERDGWFRSTCVTRRGGVALSCSNTRLSEEDWLENFALQSDFPIRLHEGICFNLRAIGTKLLCQNAELEDNCQASPIHPERIVNLRALGPVLCNPTPASTRTIVFLSFSCIGWCSRNL